MWLSYAYYVLLLTALAVMLAQLSFRPVRVEHILTAIFSGSLAMVALQVLTAESGSAYQYVFALGTCATCNVIWLISRALFRGTQALATQHYLFAGAIALLVVTNRSLELMVSVDWLTAQKIGWIQGAVSEVTQLLSSTILALAFWEAVRGFNNADKPMRHQRLLFATTFFSGVFSCTVIADGMLSGAVSGQVRPWLVVSSALAILLTTLVILVWQRQVRRQSSRLTSAASQQSQLDNTATFEDKQLAAQIRQLMEQQKCFLQHDLKTIDIATALQVSEYKVSRVIRTMTSSANVNQFINGYRIAHAKQLLTAGHCRHWTILVISLESGFASLAPFNRAFKASEGCTPNQYRQQHLAVESAQA
ncbi:AraC family transcriptional regulator [uncultured Alteromonas sp.]|jgi:AraC-like DNA-binding protein|uniref:helix-turn-helix domain-containing protein n=1 Tax=uncultured Alteromonas sp. TaxID=179113 RepID=UPI0025CE8019|nr:AraC family transcriptional regulator [uncultured Alteromonas sp.]